MKKKKLIPAILLLALCFGVLGVGVYSANVGTNTITGKLSINATGYEVSIDVYLDEVINDDGHYLGGAEASRYGRTITLKNGQPIEFNVAHANTPSDVPVIDLIIVVTNRSTTDLGVYFWNGVAASVPDIASPSDILYGEQNMSSAGHNNIVTANYSFYHEIDGYTTDIYNQNQYQSVYMHATYTLNELVNENVELNLNLYLNVEEYQKTTQATDAFYKLDSDSSTYNVFSNNTTMTNVVIPRKVTTIGASSFNCSALQYVNLHEHVTLIGAGAFGNCTSLTTIVVETTSLTDDYILPVVSGYHWEKDGVTVTEIDHDATDSGAGIYKRVADPVEEP